MKKEIKEILSKEISQMLSDYINNKEQKHTLDDIVDKIIKVTKENKDFQIDIKE
jgi:hypothetical protein